MNNSAFLSYSFSIINTMQLCVLNLDYFVFQFGINCKMIYYLCNIITTKLKKLFRFFLFFMMVTCETKLQASTCIPTGITVTLTRQSEVDSFPINYPGCDVVEGSLTISGDDIVNLNGLIGIKKVIYQLEIKNNPSLVNFNGLNTLKSAEILYVSNNNSLLNFLGLDNLEKVTSRFYVNSNDLLINFNGLNKLDYVYNFSIRVNNSLTNLIGLTNLKKIASSFYIVSNASLIDFTGISSLNEVYALNIHDNPSIINLNGFQTLSKLDNFYIVSNASLLNFFGFDNIITTHNHCRIQGNSSLLNFEGLNNWRIMNYK